MTSKDTSRFIVTGISGAIAVALGALGAHALKARVAAGDMTADQLNGFDTAARYQMYHTLAMLAVCILLRMQHSVALKWSFRLFSFGIVLFSGSLYLLCTRTLTGMPSLALLGPVTPLGGLLFIGGWIALCFAFKKG